MRALAEFLLRFVGFQEALIALGWKPPGPETQDGPGPWTPPKSKDGPGPWKPPQ